jgi:hypothetical protein
LKLSIQLGGYLALASGLAAAAATFLTFCMLVESKRREIVGTPRTVARKKGVRDQGGARKRKDVHKTSDVTDETYPPRQQSSRGWRSVFTPCQHLNYLRLSQ